MSKHIVKRRLESVKWVLFESGVWAPTREVGRALGYPQNGRIFGVRVKENSGAVGLKEGEDYLLLPTLKRVEAFREVSLSQGITPPSPNRCLLLVSPEGAERVHAFLENRKKARTKSPPVVEEAAEKEEDPVQTVTKETATVEDAVPGQSVELVAFRDDVLWAIRENANSDDVWVVVKRVCEKMGLDEEPQRKKLHEKAWAVTSMREATGPDRKIYQMFCVHLDVLPMWLATIDTSRVSPDIRDNLTEYQKECAKVLRNHFLKRGTSSDKALQTIQDLLVRQGDILVQHGHTLHNLSEIVSQQGTDIKDLQRRQTHVEKEFLAEARTIQENLTSRTINAGDRICDNPVAKDRAQRAVRNLITIYTGWEHRCWIASGCANAIPHTSNMRRQPSPVRLMLRIRFRTAAYLQLSVSQTDDVVRFCNQMIAEYECKPVAALTDEQLSRLTRAHPITTPRREAVTDFDRLMQSLHQEENPSAVRR